MAIKPIEKSKNYYSKNKKTILKFADAFFSAAALYFGLQIIAASEVETRASVLVGFALFSVLALSRLFNALADGKERKASMIKNICAMFLYIGCAILYSLLKDNILSLQIVSCVYFSEVIAGRILRMLERKTIRGYIFNGLLITIVLLYILAIFAFEEEYYSVLALVLALTIAFRSLIHIIANSFNQIKLGVLQKVIRKTFAGEIIFGLFMLVIAFTMVFVTWESETFHSYSDALWYCFAVVTTIGFGDFSATEPLTRIISVILGLYGIIVVAVITSVIINFYNEVKDDKDPEDEHDDHSEEDTEKGPEEPAPTPAPDKKSEKIITTNSIPPKKKKAASSEKQGMIPDDVKIIRKKP